MKRVAIFGIMLLILAPVIMATAQDADKQEIISKLNAKVNCDYENIPLVDVINDLKNQSGIANIVPANEVKDQFAAGEGEGITLHAKGITLRTALKLILGGRKLTAIYKDGALTITTEENAKKKVTTLVYDIRDLLYSVTNFPGPRVDLLPPDTYKEKFGGLSGGAALAGNTFTLGGSDERTTSDPGFIIDVIKKNTKGGEEGWDGDQNIEEKAGMLIVTTTKSKHEEVNKMIALIRQFK